jgi:glycerol-3-phosphate dehydrogenase (NAD(P)+)
LTTATILGAGYMGSAMTFPLAACGLSVRLWGTWLDDDLIERSRQGPHPRLRVRLPASVALYDSSQLEAAIEGADIVFMGVSSEGFAPVFERLLAVTEKPLPVFTLTKGFCQLEGEVSRTSVAARALFERKFPGREPVWTSVGGPVKAFELARGVPSPAVYASVSESAEAVAGELRTSYYRIRTTTDVAGVELCSALKNVYAIAPGLCDGLYQKEMPGNYHNFSSLLFTQAIREMVVIVAGEGGSPDTVHGLAGVGDLYVTSQSGKNQRFGALIGRGMTPEEAYRTMYDEGELAEGYLAMKAGSRWLAGNHPGLLDELPLFRALYAIGCEGAPAEASLQDLVAGFV